MTPDHFRLLERLYAQAPCNQHFEPVLEVAEGRAIVRVPITGALFHAMHAVHGSYYFKALDDAAFFAVNSVVTDVFVLTVSFSVQFLRPASSGTLVAEGRLVKKGTLLFADAVLRDDAGRELALGTGVFARSAHAIPGGSARALP
jgi:uncharacterized protein (TIGR00369 family)